MYSFNLDYIFNVVYNLFLAIRYAIVFWILRITPHEYLADHQYDTWDGLRDRGWIHDTATAVKDGTLYYGNNLANDKSPILGAIDKVPWFQGLHFSIQNPLLAFLADVLSVFSFFVLLLLIYILLKWLAIVLEPVRKIKNEKEEIQIKKKLELVEKLRILDYEKMKVGEESFKEPKLNIRENSLQEKENFSESREAALRESMPAGIPGLPIDESSLTESEQAGIERTGNLLLDYKVKHLIPKKENQILKVKISEDSAVSLYPQAKVGAALAISEEDLKRDERQAWYQARWNIILGYMESEEDALLRIGILEADNLLDTVLSEKGYVGSTLSDKLSQAAFQSIDLAWAAHKIRNRIAHDGMEFVLTQRIAKKTIESFKAVFTELKVLV